MNTMNTTITITEMICRLINKFGFDHQNTLQFKEMVESDRYGRKSLEAAYLLYMEDES